jgi:hypothetical protein
LYYQLDSTSNKYRYVFENYLNDPFDNYVIDTYEARKAPSGRILPENKKLYEIVYLNSPGDTQNMFIKMSPEDNRANPYNSEIQEIQNQRSILLSKTLSS